MDGKGKDAVRRALTCLPLRERYVAARLVLDELDLDLPAAGLLAVLHAGLLLIVVGGLACICVGDEAVLSGYLLLLLLGSGRGGSRVCLHGCCASSFASVGGSCGHAKPRWMLAGVVCVWKVCMRVSGRCTKVGCRR